MLEEMEKRPVVRGFTVDNLVHMDLDDALDLKISGEEALVTISIADVDYYVHQGTDLDDRASSRVASRYYAENRMDPMLPLRISEDIASLLPGKKRKTISVFVTLDLRDLHVISVDIRETELTSERMFKYPEIDEVLKNSSDPHHEIICQFAELANKLL